MLRKILFLFSFILLSAADSVAHVSVSVKIDSTGILIGQQAHIALKVVTDAGQRVIFPVFPNKFLTPRVEVIKENLSDAEKLNDGRQISITKTYTITAFDSALYYIPPFKVRVGNRTYASNSLALKVMTMDIDTLHLDKFYGPKDIAPVPFSWSDWRGLFLLSLLFIVLLLAMGYLWLQVHNKRPILKRFRIRPALPPHQWAMNEIRKINQKKEVHDDSKEYYTQLTNILRTYIQKRYGFNAREMTSSEIISQLTQQQDSKSVQELQQLFATADLAKFAKLRTLLNENDENLYKAMDFIKSTKIEEQDKPKKQVELPPELQRSRRSMLILKLIIAAIAVGGLLVLFFIGRSLYFLFV